MVNALAWVRVTALVCGAAYTAFVTELGTRVLDNNSDFGFFFLPCSLANFFANFLPIFARAENYDLSGRESPQYLFWNLSLLICALFPLAVDHLNQASCTLRAHSRQKLLVAKSPKILEPH